MSWRHLRRELEPARQIQSGMLLLAETLFPEREDPEVCGLVEPAASVGGDLFDALFVADGRLFVCIGDVSGHGVSAALLMARTIGLLRSLAMNTGDTAALLQNLNASLCGDNQTNLFVTLFCGVLDPATGRLVSSNAGHCSPLLVTGDLLFTHTDGITEGEDAGGRPFGLEGCEQLLRTRHHHHHHHHQHLPETLDAIRSDLHRFNSGADLDDDCTLLLLRRC